MITRIPQPELWGPAPAQVQLEQQAQGQRFAQMFQQSVQEGTRNYLMTKQLAQQKEIAQKEIASRESISAQEQKSAFQRLQMDVLSRNLMTQMQTSEDPAATFIDLAPQFKQLYGMYANGDKALADSMFQSASKQVGTLSVPSMMRRGMIGVAPGQPQEAAPTAGAAPALPGTPQQFVPGVGMMAAPAQAAPTGQPAAELAHPLPENASEMTPDLVSQMAGNQQLMDAFRGTFANNKAVLKHGTPEQNAKFLAGNKDAFVEFAKNMTPDQMKSLVGVGGSMSLSIKSVVPTETPKTALASSVMERIASGAMAPDESVTPKEAAAVKGTAQQIWKVMDNSQTKAYLALPGTSEQSLQRAADVLNQLQQSDPTFAEYMKTASTLSPAEAKEYLAYKTEERRTQQMLGYLGIAGEKNQISQGRLALDAAGLMSKLQLASENIALKLRSANTADNRAQADLLRSATTAWDAWLAKDTAARQSYMQINKGATQDQVDKYIAGIYADTNSGLSQARYFASTLVGGLTGTPVDMVDQVLGQGDPTVMHRLRLAIGLAGEKAPGTQYQTPSVPGVTAPGAAGAAPVGSPTNPLPKSLQPGALNRPGVYKPPQAPSQMTNQQLIDAAMSGQ